MADIYHKRSSCNPTNQAPPSHQRVRAPTREEQATYNRGCLLDIFASSDYLTGPRRGQQMAELRKFIQMTKDLARSSP